MQAFNAYLCTPTLEDTQPKPPDMRRTRPTYPKASQVSKP